MRNEMLESCGQFGILSGRKSRQKARRLAFKCRYQTIRVISKNGYVLYTAKYYPSESRMETWINSKEKGMIPDSRTNGKF